MAAIARMDQEKRTVEVNRVKLIEALTSNREKHVQEYDEAMAGYKAVLLSKIDQAFKDARKEIEAKYEKTKAKVTNFTDADIAKQRDSFTLIDAITVEMKVPRSYAKEYDAAIDMAKWDVRETLDLTHAEFTCFVRDQWDWKSGFEAVSMLYKAAF
jgi:hypothetical protein